MRIAVVGGGPGGLYFSILMRKIRPDCEVTVFERRAPTDAFGFGVVFSDETLTVFEHADPGDVLADRRALHALERHRHPPSGRDDDARAGMGSRPSAGASCCGSSRSGPCRSAPTCASDRGAAGVRTALGGSARRCRRGVECRAHGDGARLRAVARSPRRAGTSGSGTDVVFDAFKFFIAETEHGVVQAHAYPYDGGMSTFIVEMHERTWKRLGLGEMIGRRAAWRGRASCSPTRSTGHRWSPTTRAGSTSSRSATGAGAWTTWCCSATPRTPPTSRSARARSSRWRTPSRWPGRFACIRRRRAAATSAYEAERRPIVESTQRAAQGSLEWFEGIGRYVDQQRLQFAFNLLTRSRRVTYDNLRLRDPEFVARGASRIRGRRCSRRSGCGGSSCPTGSSSRRWTCTRRSTGRPGDFHLVHLGARALGGAGLVMTEMICVSDDRADHARVRRHVPRRARRGVGADRLVRP